MKSLKCRTTDILIKAIIPAAGALLCSGILAVSGAMPGSSLRAAAGYDKEKDRITGFTYLSDIPHTDDIILLDDAILYIDCDRTVTSIMSRGNDLTIAGNGKNVLNAGSIYVYDGTFTMRDGNANVRGIAVEQQTRSFNDDDITFFMNGGNLTSYADIHISRGGFAITGGTLGVTTTNDTAFMSVSGNAYVSGGNLNLVRNFSAGEGSNVKPQQYGLYCGGKLTISGGNITVRWGNDTVRGGRGVFPEKGLYMDGGILHVRGYDQAIAVYEDSELTLDGVGITRPYGKTFTTFTKNGIRYRVITFGEKQETDVILSAGGAIGVEGDVLPAPADAQIRAFVERMYAVMLRRNGDQAGIDDWTNQLVARNKTGAGVAQGFVMSRELADQNISDEEFVQRLYRTFFNDDGDEEGRAYWVKELKKGHSRKFVFRGFAESEQFSELCWSYGIERGNVDLSDKDKECSDENLHIDENKVEQYVSRLYTTILGRPADEAGLVYWTDRIVDREETAAAVAMRGFFHSEEYLNAGKNDEAFIRDLYRSMLGREADAAGVAYWLEQLGNGTITRDRLIEAGFGNSDEFGAILQSYGLKKLDK